MIRRSILFCPASRPERFAKAIASGADSVCLDLEDGVGPADKDRARDAVAEFLREGDLAAHPCEIVVRVNDPTSALGENDVEMILGGPRPHALMIPKVDGPGELTGLARALGRGRSENAPALLPLIETASGLRCVEEIGDSGLPLGAFVFGGMDLAAELGARFEWDSLLYARSRIVHAAALAGIGAIDVPWAPLDDPEGLEAETRRAARLGFTGKLAIHPAQVGPIHKGLVPLPDELEGARRIVEAARSTTEGVVVVDGRMVDRPIVLAAERTLARAGEEGPTAHAP